MVVNACSQRPANSSTPKPAQRHYTNNLGTPTHLETPDSLLHSPRSSQDPSEISDGGQQLGLHHKRKPSATSDQSEPYYDQRRSGRVPSKIASRYELQRKIIAAFKKTQTSHGQSLEFLPEGDLYKLINPLSVGQELKNSLGQMHSPEIIDAFTKKICGETRVVWGGKSKIRTFRKIFALLVLVGTTTSTPFFLEKEVSDLNLPLEPLSHGESPSHQVDDIGNDGRSQSLGHTDHFEDLDWSPIQLRTFQDYQWKMLAPFFAKGKHGDVKHYLLHDQHILPFLSIDTADKNVAKNAEKGGGFSRVVMVRIHEAHHNFHDQELCSNGFAVKQQIHEGDRKTFWKEIAVLKKFSGEGREHEHIISLLATFEKFDKLNLLFYQADGDLFAYWASIGRVPSFTHDNVRWVAKQCEGLVGALSRVHRYLTFTERPEDASDASSGKPTGKAPARLIRKL